MTHKIIRCFPLLTVPVAMLCGCISSDSDLLDAKDGCEELSSGDVDAIADANVRMLMQASIDLTQLSEELQAEVVVACSNIAIDLGATETWSTIEDLNDRVSNENGTGACDVALSEVTAVFDAAAEANIDIALAITRGACYPDFEGQAQCEIGCAANTECTPGSIETRCEPGSLSVQCEAACSADAYCAGTPELPANCMGQCEASCQGECQGSCIAPDGSVTENDPNCHGKCSSSCNGLCQGMCKIEAPEGIECGAEVSCQGGCTGSFTEPKCVDEFTPPTCTIDSECYASCAAEACANAVCDPPRIEVYVDVDLMAEGKLQILSDTLETNLSALIAASETKGKLAVQAVGRLRVAAVALAENAGDLEGKELACAGASAEATVHAAVSLEASFHGSAAVVEQCTSSMQ